MEASRSPGAVGTSSLLPMHHRSPGEDEVRAYRHRLILLFTGVKLCLFILAAVCAVAIQPYNPSIGLILFPKRQPFVSLVDWWMKRLLRPFASWDGGYFMSIALKGYVFEQEHAFFPLYPLLVRTFADTLLYPMSGLLSLPARCLISGVLISNGCHFISVLTMYDISLHIFDDGYFSFLSAAFLLLVPAQAVMSAVYSESLFTCLCLLGLCAFYGRLRVRAALAWCMASATRSNGVFMSGFLVYEYLHKIRHISSHKAFVRFIQLVILCMVSWTGFLAVLRFGQHLYCDAGNPRPWCHATLPNIYAFVQAHYWKVGFLKYYRPSQIPNFILATPMVIFSLVGIYTYMRTDWAWSLSAGLVHRELSVKKRPYYARELLPHIYLWGFMLAYTVLVVHVQIITRLFMFMPIVSWYHAHLYYMAGGHSQAKCISRRRLHLGIIGTYICVTSILFFCYYPPA